MVSPSDPVEFYDLHPKPTDLYLEVYQGLQKNKKSIPPKFFYDEKGSDLFSKITQLEEYYLTDTEKKILRENGAHIGEFIGEQSIIIEYGCGSSEKIQILLDFLCRPKSYVAIDISKEHLLGMTQGLKKTYPELEVIAVCADFTSSFQLPLNGEHKAYKKVVFFPGSTIGNFEPEEAEVFLSNVTGVVGSNGGLLIGVDLKKDLEALQSAYNDTKGVTSDFNKNLLSRINRECESNFNLDNFKHHVFYNQEHGRIEMHLKSLVDQTIHFNESPINFKSGETIHTENSYKYSLEEFQNLANSAGWTRRQFWTDKQGLFSLQYFEIE